MFGVLAWDLGFGGGDDNVPLHCYTCWLLHVVGCFMSLFVFLEIDNVLCICVCFLMKLFRFTRILVRRCVSTLQHECNEICLKWSSCEPRQSSAQNWHTAVGISKFIFQDAPLEHFHFFGRNELPIGRKTCKTQPG